MNINVMTNEFDYYYLKIFYPDINVVFNKPSPLYINFLSFDRNSDNSLHITRIISCNYLCNLFPPLSSPNLCNDLKITDVGLYSVTPYIHVKNMISKLQFDTQKLSIFDATACVGGDTIAFSFYFKNIFSIEKDPVNYFVLNNNINVYNKKNITTYLGDFNDEYKKILNNNKIDVIYFDPPWGGSDYKYKKNLDLFLGKRNIIDIITELKNMYNIILKVPKNYNISSLSHLKYNIIISNKFDYIIFYK